MAEMHIVLGVDIGGSHITSALIDTQTGEIVEGSLSRSKVDSQGDAADILRQWCEVMKSSLSTRENSGCIAIAMPGPFDYSTGISLMKGMGKFEALYGINVRNLILKGLKGVAKEVWFVNDAGCFLQGEISYGPASNYKKVLGITLGTGFGSAIGVNGVSKDAEFWRYPFMGATCEYFFSSKWLVARYNTIAENHVANVKELIDNAQKSNPLLQVFDEFAYNLGVFLAKIAREYRFDAVVMGGNIAKASSLFLPQIKAYLKVRGIDLVVLISKNGENAALIGAASTICTLGHFDFAQNAPST